MSKFLGKKLANTVPYVPGEQPKDKQYIKLNTNESPYPPAPQVIKAVCATEIERLNLYPDPECTQLRNVLADAYNVSAKNILPTNGSDEVLSFAFMAYCDDETGAAFPDITYGFYPVFADLYGVKYTEIPLKDDFTIDVKEYENLGKTIFIANPNAPTGLSLSLDDIEHVLQTNPNNVVVIDEAYIDFGGCDCSSLIHKYDNLLVSMTYSKSRSLAGARLGFAIASEEIINDLNRVKYSTNPYNINRLTAVAGVAAIEGNDYYVEKVAQIKATREYTRAKLLEMGFEVNASDANFLFAKPPVDSGVDGEEFYEELKNRGVLIRHFNKDKIKDYVRITIGTQAEMEKMLETAEVILKENK